MRVCARAPIAQLLNPKIYSPGNFEGTRTKDGCRFSRTESFGITMPVIGPIMNFLLFKIIFRKKSTNQNLAMVYKLVYTKTINTSTRIRSEASSGIGELKPPHE